MAVNLSPLGGAGAQFFTNDGAPLTGGLLYTYLAGTSTPATTYTSSSGITALANPIILDAAGRVPTGEIWLSDGISYKFVLKDSTDVLIATWDGLSGINSNFIAFTAQEETATATAGQTVFNLSLSYLPATNNLAVFVNGSNQIVSVNYLETDDNTVTFLTGLNVGDVVKFSTATPVATNSMDAANVSYTPAGVDAVTTNVQAKLRESVSVQDFGAVGDGTTDDTTAIQNALDSLSATGGVVYAPEGQYRLTAKITIPSFVKLQGANWLPDPSNGAQVFATSLYIDWGAGADNHAVEMSHSSAIEGFTFFYPGQVAKTVSTPITFGYSISTPAAVSTYDNIQVKNITLYNSYKGIRLNNAGRFRVDQIQGTPLSIGFTADNCYDVCYMSGVHFWTFYSQTPSNLATWILNNGIAFDLRRVDQLYATDLFCYGYLNGFYCRDNLWANFVNILTDVCVYPFTQELSSRVRVSNFEFISTAADKPGVWFRGNGILEMTNGQIANTSSVGVQVDNSGTVLLNNIVFSNQHSAVVATSTTSDVSINNCTWDVPPFGQYNVKIDGIPLPQANTTVTLPSPSVAPTAISGGYQFDLSTATTRVLQYDILNISQRNSLYVLQFDYELVNNPTTWYFQFQISTDVGTEVQVLYAPTYALVLNTDVSQTTRTAWIPFFINGSNVNQRLSITTIATVGTAGASLKLTNIALKEQLNKFTTDAQVSMMMKNGYNLDAFGYGQSLMAKGKNRTICVPPVPAIGRTTEVPTQGTWEVGDQALVYSPASGGYIGYVCTTAGTPGTWKSFGLIS
jgi:hypothetical protein